MTLRENAFGQKLLSELKGKKRLKMPNIILTTYCNLSCPYCFANSIKQNHINISIQQLNQILEWLKPTAIENPSKVRIGLIGGEPTLHPSFSYLLKKIDIFCELYNTRSILFTNGIELYKYLNNFPKHISILLNYNSPILLNNDQQQKIQLSLNAADKSYLTLGCNICEQINDYNFFWEAVKTYDIDKVRVAVTSPINYIQKRNQEKYYNNLKEKYLIFLDNAKKYHVKVFFDCSQIPLCYFTNKEIEQYNIPNKICSPVLDITPDFKLIPCFGINEQIDNNFKNIIEARQYINKNYHQIYLQQNIKNKCLTCSYYLNHECQNGCFGFLK